MNTTLSANESLQRLKSVLDNKYENRRYRTSNAHVQAGGITRDEFRRPTKARVTIDGISDYVLPCFGFDITEGQQVEVENVGTESAAVYRFVGTAPGTPSGAPALIGSPSGGYDLLNLPGIRVRSDGFIILGGDLDEAPDGTLTPSGGRIEERKYGIIGYEIGGRMAFGLFAQDFLYQLETPHLQFEAGDAILGRPSLGHLLVQSKQAKMSWMFGEDILFQSQLVDNNPFHFMRGLLRVADKHVGEAIELGKQPGGPFVFQMLNENGVPMFLVRVGFDADPGHYYLRIGRPSPSAHIELTDVNGEPVIKIGGATLTQATIQAANLIGTIPNANLDIVGLTYLFAPAVHTHLLTKAVKFTVAGTLTASTQPLRIYNRSGKARTITQVHISANTAPTGAAIIIDTNLGGTTIFTNQANRPQIAVSAFEGNTTTIDVSAWPDGGYLQIDVDQIGSGVAGADLAALVLYTELT